MNNTEKPDASLATISPMTRALGAIASWQNGKPNFKKTNLCQEIVSKVSPAVCCPACN